MFCRLWVWLFDFAAEFAGCVLWLIFDVRLWVDFLVLRFGVGGLCVSGWFVGLVGFGVSPRFVFGWSGLGWVGCCIWCD